MVKNSSVYRRLFRYHWPKVPTIWSLFLLNDKYFEVNWLFNPLEFHADHLNFKSLKNATFERLKYWDDEKINWFKICNWEAIRISYLQNENEWGYHQRRKLKIFNIIKLTILYKNTRPLTNLKYKYNLLRYILHGHNSCFKSFPHKDWKLHIFFGYTPQKSIQS